MRKRSAKAGLPPGTVVHIGEPKTAGVTLTIFDFAADRCDERVVTQIADLPPLREGAVAWLNIGGVHRVDLLDALGKRFQLHPLLLEDIANTDQRPKLEDYGRYLFLVVKMLTTSAKGEIQVEQVSFVLGANFVLSFQENGSDVFHSVRDRLRGGKGRLRQSGSDYLLYALVDAIVDHYFIALEVLGERIETLQERVIADPQPDTLRDIHALKRELLVIRRAVWPLREAMNNLSRAEGSFLGEATKPFFRDVYDHVIQIVDTIETLREIVSASLDIYLSSVSYRLNSVMRVLTVITTIFMPLSFIASIYGMNFEYMPELKWAWGYPVVLGLMGIVATVMLAGFRRRKWL